MNTPNKQIITREIDDHRFKSAIDSHLRGHYIHAKKIYKKLLKKYPNHPDLLHLLGIVEHQTGKHQNAVKLIERAISINPEISDYYNNCGEAYRAFNKLDSAIRCYKKAIELTPEFFEAYNNIANVLKAKGEVKEALINYEKAISIKPDYIIAQLNLAVLLSETGEHEKALQTLEKIIILNSNIPEVYFNLGNIYRDLNELEKAIANYEKALEIKPEYIAAQNNYALTLVLSGEFEDAANHYYLALKLAPDSAEINNNLGDLLQNQEKLIEAITYYKNAIKLKPDYAIAYNNLGTVYKELGDIELAITFYNKAILLNPESAKFYNNLGNAYKAIGNIKKATEYYEEAIKLRPKLAETYRHLSLICNYSISDPITFTIKNLLESADLKDEDAIHLHYALGKIFENNHDYDLAFKHFFKANKISNKIFPFNKDFYNNKIDNLVNIFTKTLFNKYPEIGNKSDLPVFIVGMPRSGTTLVEQIIASHHHAFGAGELGYFTYISQNLSDIIIKNKISEYEITNDNAINDIADSYIDTLRYYSHDSYRIVDKMPLNFLHLGIILLTFPNARIIHCCRNPLDTCISIFCNYFIGKHNYAHMLEDLGLYFWGYHKLMAHWRNVLPTKILDIEYEELVNNQEKIIKKIIEHIGLEWDESCLEFYNNNRPVQTASNLQVKKPIYKNSIDRWKHYEKNLDPLFNVLKM